MAARQQLTARLNDRELPLATGHDIDTLLAQVEAADSVDLLVETRGSEMRGFERLLYRLLGLSASTAEPRLSLLKNGPLATLTFLNAAWSEARAIDLERPLTDDGTVWFTLATGEKESSPAAECLSSTRALAAMREFLRTGARPSWLSYKVMR